MKYYIETAAEMLTERPVMFALIFAIGCVLGYIWG